MSPEESTTEAKEAKQAILDRCAQWEQEGYVVIEAHGDGSGDSGSLCDITARKEGEDSYSGTNIMPEKWNDPLVQEFDNILNPYVDYNNDGGGGYVRVYIKERRITVESYYYENVTQTAEAEHDI